MADWSSPAALAEAVARDGFHGPTPLLPPAHASRLADQFGRDLAWAGPRLSNWHLRVGWAEELAVDERLRALAEAVLGEPAEPWASEIWFKPAHHRRVVPWHQDEIYWPLRGLLTVSVWLALTPSGPHNGGLAFVPGTHRQALAHRPSANPAHWLDHEVHGEVLRAVTPMVPAGSAMVFADRVVHGSAANASAMPRLAMSFRYTARHDKLIVNGLTYLPVRRTGPGGNSFVVAWSRAPADDGFTAGRP